MINLNFFPSRQLALYMARLFLTRSLAVLVALVLVLMTLDLLGESGKILAVPGNGEAELWRYVSLRVPLLVSRFLPFSVLLGTLIAFAGLNQHSEVVAMKAAGMSAHQILAPMIVASLGVAAHRLRLQRDRGGQAPRARSMPGPTPTIEPIPPDSGILTNVWVRDGDDLVHAGMVAGRGADDAARGRHDLRARGRRARAGDRRRAGAASGRGGWRLARRPHLRRAHEHGRARRPTIDALDGVEPTRFTLAKVDPDERRISSRSSEAIADSRRAGRPTEDARSRLVAQDQRAAVDRADAAAGGGSPPSAWPGRARCCSAPRSAWRSASLISWPTISASRWAMSAPTRRCSRPGRRSCCSC